MANLNELVFTGLNSKKVKSKFDYKATPVLGRPNTYSLSEKELILVFECELSKFPINFSVDLPPEFKLELYVNFDGTKPMVS